jgi:hypothetical protein
MQGTISVEEIKNKLKHLRATTSVWMPMGHFILIKILLRRQNKNLTKMVWGLVEEEIEKTFRKNEKIPKEELIYELQSLKKPALRKSASTCLNIDLGPETFPEQISPQKYLRDKTEQLMSLTGDAKTAKLFEELIEAIRERKRGNQVTTDKT